MIRLFVLKIKLLRFILIFTFIFPTFAMQNVPEATEKEKKLYDAIERGDVTEVQRLVDLEKFGVRVTDVRMYKRNKVDPVSLAEQKGNKEIINILQNSRSDTMEKAFFKAAREGDVETIKNIINERKDLLDRQAWGGDTALMTAVKNGHIEMVQELLRLRADLNIKNNEEEMPLTLAIKRQDIQMVRTLLNNALVKIIINARDKDGNTPLMLAAKNNNIEIVKEILTEVPAPLVQNEKGKTAMMLTQLDEIRNLLLPAQDAYNLWQAIIKSDFDTMKKLIPRVDISKITSLYKNPLVAALRDEIGISEEDTPPKVQFLIDQGIDINQTLKLGMSPLMIAIAPDFGPALDPQQKLNQLALAKFLLKKGANPNAARFDGKTPIFIAVDSLLSLIIPDLVQHKADINYQIPNITIFRKGKFDQVHNMTLLMLEAAQRGRLDKVKELIKLGADPSLKNSEGKTAQDMAREAFATEVADFLKTAEKTEQKTIPDQSLIHLLRNFTQKLYTIQNALLK